MGELSVGDHLQAAEVKAKVEINANLPGGAHIRTLLWGSCELQGALTLRELGMCGAQEVVAVCAQSIEGDFGAFRRGCPCCDEPDDVSHMRFELSGVASLSNFCDIEETWTFRYTLGEVEEASLKEGFAPGMLRRGLNLELLQEGEDDNESAALFEGWLEFDEIDPIQRRVRIVRWKSKLLRVVDMCLNLEDLRALQHREQEEARMNGRWFREEEKAQMSGHFFYYYYGREEGRPLYLEHLDRDDEGLPGEDLLLHSFPAPRERRPKPNYGRRNHCSCGLSCQGRRSHATRFHCILRQSDARAAAVLARSRTRRSRTRRLERDLKMVV